MMNKILLLTLLAISAAQAQIVTLTPAIVTQNDTVTITFDATQGNAGLVGVSPVYMHTGVVTNLSTSSTNWRHVQGNWGTADPKVLMTSIGNNKHQLKYHINTFYNVPANETVFSLAFVFRNVDGSKEGKTASGGDIFVPISQGGYTAFITSHPSRQYVYAQGDTVPFSAAASVASTITFLLDGLQIAQATNATVLNFDLFTANYSSGFHTVVMTATNGTASTSDTVYYLTRSGSPIGVLPSYAEEGLKSLNDSTMYFQLRAPYKNYAYLVGDFNDWLLKPEYELYKTPDGQFFFREITGLDKNTEYGFQYYIGTEGMLITDPYAEKILDPWNDGYITNTTYPNLKDYPAGKTSEIVGVFQIEEPAYSWSSTNYQRPAKEELVIYELLVRDFDLAHNYDAVIKKLDYLQWLGINAIELMPVMEFEGNQSWGYMPMFMMAPDKYYGPKNELKRLVDSCHARGMAVILDIALNHSFGQNPMVRMYFDPNAGQWGQTTAQSPWFNAVAKHDFNVGYDYNHQSAATKYYSKKVIAHWLTEYKIDGYRFDLSKGFTQVNTLGNTAAWGNYDQSRINIWKDYSSHLWSVDSTAYVILEHFADNSEETVLSNENMMLWGNMNHSYTEAAMGYAADLTGVSHKSRNWNDMHLVGFMESHDEERMMYKTPKFGNSNTTYSTKNLDTALQRMELAAAFFYTIPGPKMLWQFGELGYDFSINRCPDGTINTDCRTYNKPIRWDYYYEENRKQLYNVVGELNYLRKNYSVFRQDKQAELSLNGITKRIKLQDSTMQVVVLGNFDIIQKSINPSFHKTGWWFEHFTQDSLLVTNTTDNIILKPGEYRLYSTTRMAKSAISVEEEREIAENSVVEVYPLPFTNAVTINIASNFLGNGTVQITDINGRLIWQSGIDKTESSTEITWNGTHNSGPEVAAGIYLYRVVLGNEVFVGKLVKQ